MARSYSYALLGGSLALACSSAPPPPPAAPPPAEPCQRTSVTVTVAAGEQVNASAGGPGLPVQVRIYQLKSDSALRAAAFDEVWQNDKGVLRDDLLKMDEQTAYPGKTVYAKLGLLPAATSIAAVALFRDPKGKDWFSTFELEPLKKQPPCAPAESQISVWLDRMKIQDGSGQEVQGARAPRP